MGTGTEQMQYICYNHSKKVIYSSQFEFEEKLSQKTREINSLGIKLNDEELKCKSLRMINKKLQHQLLINRGNINEMKTIINDLRNTVSQYKQSADTVIDVDIGVQRDVVKVGFVACAVAVCYYWFCCCI